MPRFYFDVREGSRLSVDEDGLELPGPAEAEREAVDAAASIGRDRLPRADTRDVEVRVRDEAGRRLLSVRISLEIDRAHP